MDQSDAGKISQDNLIADVKLIASDVEKLVRSLASGTGETFASAQAQLTERLEGLSVQLGKLQTTLVDTAQATDTYVHENPWKAVGIAAGIAFTAGLLISRR